MPERNSKIQLQNLGLVALSFIVVTIFIYVTKGITLYWPLYSIPLIIAALSYNIVGGLTLGVLGAAATAGWMIYLNPHLTSALNENMTNRIIEITIGLAIYIGMGAALGYLVQCRKEQRTLLESLSVHDRLTGLYNYGYFVDMMTAEKIRTDRYGSFFSLIMFDIDSFKDFNDTYGHEAGNEVIKRIGKTILKSVRNVDIVSRYSGEEFAVLLPYALSYETQKVAERIRDAVAGEEFNFAEVGGKSRKTPSKVTVSAGIATYPTDAKNETELIINAYRALYHAKTAGKNKVAVFAKANGERDQNLIRH